MDSKIFNTSVYDICLSAQCTHGPRSKNRWVKFGGQFVLVVDFVYEKHKKVCIVLLTP